MDKVQKNTQGNTQKPDWFQDAKFGLFLHWGAYSVAGVEASWPIMAPDLSEAMFQNQTKITENSAIIRLLCFMRFQ